MGKDEIWGSLIETNGLPKKRLKGLGLTEKAKVAGMGTFSCRFGVIAEQIVSPSKIQALHTTQYEVVVGVD